MVSSDESDLERVRALLRELGDDPRLTALSEQVDVLVERSRRREEWLRASHDITRTLLTSVDPARTLRLVAERARVLADAPAAAIALPDPHQPGNLVFEVVDGAGMDAEKLNGLSIPMDEIGSGQVFRSGQSAMFRDYGIHATSRNDDPNVEFPPRVRDLDCAIAVPLAFGADVRGVLLLARFRGDPVFTSTDMELAEMFAGQATLAVEVARAEQDRRTLAVFADRDRIARDLHDLVIQRLFAIGLELLSLHAIAKRSSGRISSLVAEIDQTIQDIRRTIFSLHEVTDGGGAHLRADLMDTTREAATVLGFAPKLGFDGPLDSLVPDEVRPDLLATLREALSNVARHAVASAVSVEVTVDRAGEVLTLEVVDDGVGLPVERRRSSGLTNLAERAKRWGGTLELDASPDGGTRLCWTVPLGLANS